MNSNFPIFLLLSVVVNDPAFRRKTLLTPARPPLGVTESAADGVVFMKVSMSARKYGSYEPPDPAICYTRVPARLEIRMARAVCSFDNLQAAC